MSRQADLQLVDGGGAVDLPPLTRQPHYLRFPRTVAQIQSIAGLKRTALLARLRITDEKDPDYVGPEAISFLIRRHRLDDDQRLVSDLMGILVDRCIPAIATGVKGLAFEDREDVQQEVLEKLITLLLGDSDRADFAQVRFWTFLKALRLTACSRLNNHRKLLDPLHDEHVDALAAEKDPRLSPEELAQLGEGLGALDPKLRQVFIMRHLWGWSIGREDGAPDAPGDQSLATYFNKTPRTIRNWLTKANLALARFQKD